MIGIVLAAGSGGRVGGRKARLLAFGVTLAAAHAQRLREAELEPLVVLHPDDRALELGGARVVISTASEQAGSLARALDAVPFEGDAIALVTPVDALPANVATLRALAAALGRTVDAAVPTFGGKRGHPVAVRFAVLAAGRGHPLRDVLERLGERCAWVAVDDPAVVTDLDTPDDVVGALGAPPRFAV